MHGQEALLVRGVAEERVLAGFGEGVVVVLLFGLTIGARLRGTDLAFVGEGDGPADGCEAVPDFGEGHEAPWCGYGSAGGRERMGRAGMKSKPGRMGVPKWAEGHYFRAEPRTNLLAKRAKKAFATCYGVNLARG